MSEHVGDRVARYGTAYQADYGFERHQVAARRRLLLRRIAELRPDVVVETGCGTELLVEYVAAAGIRVRRWVIAEPCAPFAAAARAAAARIDGLSVVAGRTEDATGEIVRAAGGAADLVICSSLLHEVADPAALLAACHELLAGGTGLLHVNVPNARSLHRRLARAAGLIADESALSPRNVALEQPRVFDHERLHGMVAEAGFSVRASGGYLLKPFTHAQMEQCAFLDEQLIAGLYLLGEELPELASEIWVDARPDSRH